MGGLGIKPSGHWLMLIYKLVDSLSLTCAILHCCLARSQRIYAMPKGRVNKFRSYWTIPTGRNANSSSPKLISSAKV